MRPVTQAEATAAGRVWTQQAARRSALVLTLSDAAGGEEDGRAAELLAAFLRRCTSAMYSTAVSAGAGAAAGAARGDGGGAVKVMVSGPTEGVFPGTQERVRAIFAQAFAQLF